MEHKNKKNKRAKTMIGILLLIVVAYVIWTNFDLADWPRLWVVSEGPKTTCTEIRAPKMMTDTVVEKLKVMDAGFKVINDEARAELDVKNIGETAGEVRVMLYCKDGDQQGEQTESIEPGATETFSFLDVADCDLDYIIEPELMTKKVNRTAYATDSVCE